MEITKIKCDGCRTEAESGPGWLVVITPTAPGETGIAFGRIEDEDRLEDPALKVEHICGHACAIKRFSQWLGTL